MSANRLRTGFPCVSFYAERALSLRHETYVRVPPPPQWEIDQTCHTEKFEFVRLEEN